MPTVGQSTGNVTAVVASSPQLNDFCVAIEQVSQVSIIHQLIDIQIRRLKIIETESEYNTD